MDFDNFDDLLVNLKKKYEPKTNIEKLQKENNQIFEEWLSNYYKISQAYILALFLKNKELGIDKIIELVTKEDKKLKEYMYDCMKDM